MKVSSYSVLILTDKTSGEVQDGCTRQERYDLEEHMADYSIWAEIDDVRWLAGCRGCL